MTRAMVLRPLVAVALTAVLAGCLKIDMDLDINEDESVDGEIILAVSEELAQLTGQSRDDLIEQFEADVMRDAPNGVTHEPYESEGLAGTRLILDGVALDEFDPAAGTMTITHQGDHYVVDGRFDVSAVGDLGELSDSQREAFEGIAETMDVRLAITFPGEVIEHNGELDGRTVTWTATGPEPVDISARAEDSASDSFTGPILAAVLIVIAVAALALRGRRQRDRQHRPSSDAIES